jgi:hypothetical protein
MTAMRFARTASRGAAWAQGLGALGPDPRIDRWDNRALPLLPSSVIKLSEIKRRCSNRRLRLLSWYEALPQAGRLREYIA